ncbi:MAG: hypothetical protein U0Q16_01110 [Bryobacteraceae bacterium]
MRTLGAIAVCWVACAQQPALDQAWDAHRIAEARQPGHTAKLMTYLDSPDPRVRGAAVDALIRTGAVVPQERLGRLDSHMFDSKIVLLARDPSSSGVLFDLLATGHLTDIRWAAIHNVLAARKYPKIVGPLLKSIVFDVKVSVGDHGASVGIAGGMLFSTGGPAPPGGFPPPYFYVLVIDRATDDEIAADGVHPIYARRVLPGCQSSGRIPRNEYAFGYIATMLDTPPDRMPIQLSNDVIVRRAEEAGPAVRRFGRAVDTIVNRLVARGLLAREEALTSRPRLVVTVQ